MKILVDADGHPKMIKEILFRASERLKIPLIMVSNQKLDLPNSKFISGIIVNEGPDQADNKIVELVEPGDLVITGDIPLADRSITRGAHVIGTRGETYTKDTIKQRLTMRNFMSELRDSGVQTGGPSIFKPKDRLAFANALDVFLTKRLKGET